MRMLMLVAYSALGCALIPGAAQQTTPKPVSVVEDWSSRHIVFVEQAPPAELEKLLHESRFRRQLYRRHLSRPLPVIRQENQRGPESRRDSTNEDSDAASDRDWSVSLGGGSGGTISGPAKFVFDVTAAPNCTNDFVTTGINAAGSSTQANIIGLNNLYANPTGTGFCTGTGPKVIFAYNVGTGVVTSYVALSEDGTKIAFSETNSGSTLCKFHVLKYAAGTGNGTSATAPAVPGTGNSAVDNQITFSGTTSTTAPFINYDDDVAYVTTVSSTASVVHKITGVFNGTPTEVTIGGWPATIPGNPSISSPVFDGTSKHVFMTDVNGFIDYVDDSVSPAVVKSGSFSIASSGNTALPVIVDSSRQKVYAFLNNPNGAGPVVAQGDTNLTSGSKVVVDLGVTSSTRILGGDFNNSYYASGASTAAFLYTVGNDSSLIPQPALFNIGFNSSFTMNNSTANGPLALSTGITSGVSASPLTEFYNTTTSKDYLFVGTTSNCTSLIGGGCIRSLTINSFPATLTLNSVILAAPGGTGTITVDNNSSQSQASSVYYTTLSGNTIVKATQAGLQ